MFKIVEHNQRIACSQDAHNGRDWRLALTFVFAERPEHRLHDPRRIGEVCEVYGDGAIQELPGRLMSDLEREPRFAASSGPRDSEQTEVRVEQELTRRDDIALAPKERTRLRRQAVSAARLERALWMTT